MYWLLHACFISELQDITFHMGSHISPYHKYTEQLASACC